MRILMLDLDTLRPDHLSCYGYNRNTSPNIDSICKDAMRFDNYHCTDAPCLPSRAALSTGMYGIHSFAINHGNTNAELRTYGVGRSFQNQDTSNNLFNIFRKAGMHTASISSFGERHSSYWFNAGFKEIYNCGKGGREIADDVMPIAVDWFEKNAQKDNWFLHLNMWDAHQPYRSPMEYGNPFEDEPLDNWINQDIIDKHLKTVGPHTINELGMFTDEISDNFPRQIGRATNMEEVKTIFDGYDCGIRYMDDKIGQIIELLKAKGIYDDTAIIITSDHGENIGEFAIYGEHGIADEITTRIPMIIKWPNMKTGVALGIHGNIDLAPTLAELLGVNKSSNWDGISYADTLKNGDDKGREYLVISQCAHVCQRSVRFGDYIYIRTYHDGFRLFPTEMLFNLKEDFYEQNDIADENPDICAKACRYLTEWTQEMMMTSRSPIDPMWQVIREGGPFHALLEELPAYCERLENTGRAEGAAKLRAKYPEAFK